MGWTSSLMGVGSLVLIVAGYGPSLATVIPCWRCSTAYCGPTARRSRTIRMSHVSNKRLQQQRRVMSAAAEGSGDSYKWAMWKGRARRAMKYVSMPIVSIPGQPREQVRSACLGTYRSPLQFPTQSVEMGRCNHDLRAGHLTLRLFRLKLSTSGLKKVPWQCYEEALVLTCWLLGRFIAKLDSCLNNSTLSDALDQAKSKKVAPNTRA